MFTWIVSSTLIATVALFILVEGAVLYRIGAQARRERVSATNWATQAAWAVVPLLIVCGLLLVAWSATHPGASATTARPPTVGRAP